MPVAAEQIKQLADGLGYAACGIASTEPFAEFETALDERIRLFPESAALYERMRGRGNPRAAADWARSIVVCVRRYGKYAFPPGLKGHIGRTYLFDRRARSCPEYGMTGAMTAGLKELGLRTRRGGVPDRWAGARAGVTGFARNCFAVGEHGSWINLETWLVDVELPPDEPASRAPCPAGCRACIDACPTGALSEPFVIRMDRCVAYLTYHAPEPVDPGLWERMGCWIYGCDRCQEVCPLNRGKWEDLEQADWLREAAPFLTPEALATMDDETYRRVVHPLFWYIPVDNPQRWRHNAARALDHAARHPVTT